MVGGVGVEPTHPEGTDLQSAATLRLRRPPIYGDSEEIIMDRLNDSNFDGATTPSVIIFNS